MKKPAASVKIDEAFYKQVLKFVSRRVSRLEDAEEIVQEVFVRLIRHVPNNEANITGWVYRVARNATIDFYRRSKNRKFSEFDENLFSTELTDETKYEVSSCIRPLVQNLENEDKDIIEKIDLNEMSQKELADKLNIPYPTLKSKLQRARKKLKESLVNCCNLSLSKSGLPVDFNGKNDSCC